MGRVKRSLKLTKIAFIYAILFYLIIDGKKRGDDFFDTSLYILMFFSFPNLVRSALTFNFMVISIAIIRIPIDGLIGIWNFICENLEVFSYFINRNKEKRENKQYIQRMQQENAFYNEYPEYVHLSSQELMEIAMQKIKETSSEQ